MRRIGFVSALVLGLLLGLTFAGGSARPQLTAHHRAGSTGLTYAFAEAPGWYGTLSDGYVGWQVSNTGVVQPYGAPFWGDLANKGVTDIVAITPTSNSGGYWLLGADGGVFGFGNAHFYGSVPQTGPLPAGVTALALVPCSQDHGYLIVTTDRLYQSFGPDC